MTLQRPVAGQCGPGKQPGLLHLQLQHESNEAPVRYGSGSVHARHVMVTPWVP